MRLYSITINHTVFIYIELIRISEIYPELEYQLTTQADDMDSLSRCHNIPSKLTEKEKSKMNSNVVDLDLAKNIFHPHKLSTEGIVG